MLLRKVIKVLHMIVCLSCEEKLQICRKSKFHFVLNNCYMCVTE